MPHLVLVHPVQQAQKHIYYEEHQNKAVLHAQLLHHV